MEKAFCISMLLLVFVSLGFADSAPPMPPQIHLNLTENGQLYTGSANVSYVCLSANQSNTTDNESGDIALKCVKGLCNNGIAWDYMQRSWYYPGTPCFYSVGKFRVEAGGKTQLSSQVSVERAGEYGFEFDVSTGELGASPDNPPPGRRPENPCCVPMALLGLLFSVAIAARGR